MSTLCMVGQSHVPDQTNVEDGCVVWGRRVIIPSAYTKQLLHELHAMHLAMVRMKAIDQSFMWWPVIHSDIEEMVRRCPECSRQRNAPTAAPLMPWLWATRPWQRVVHVDFAEKNGKMFPVVADHYWKPQLEAR